MRFVCHLGSPEAFVAEDAKLAHTSLTVAYHLYLDPKQGTGSRLKTRCRLLLLRLCLGFSGLSDMHIGPCRYQYMSLASIQEVASIRL